MAIYRSSALVGSISGALGGVVFVAGAASPTVRHRPRSPGGASPNHAHQQSLFTQIQRTWRGLTTLNQTAFRTLAAQMPTHNRLGQSRPLSPFQFYVQYAWRHFQRVGTVPTAVAAPLSSEFPTSMSISADISSGTQIVNTPAPLATSYEMLVYGATLNRDTPVATYNNYRFLGYFSQSGVFPANITSAWDAQWPAVREDQIIAIHVKYLGGNYAYVQQLTQTATTVP